MGGATESEFSSTEVAHELVYEIYKVAPGVLISVIPILEQALKATLFLLLFYYYSGSWCQFSLLTIFSLHF